MNRPRTWHMVFGWSFFAILQMWAAAGRAQTFFQPAPVAPRDFGIMAWGESPSDPDQLRGMAEAGLNISGFCRPEDLDRVRAAGLACFVNDRRVNGYDWSKLPEESELRRQVTNAVRDDSGHPAALGFFLRDEPGTPIMPGLGRMGALIAEAAPGKWAYVNLFPTYATVGQLGAASYEDYVRAFIRDAHPPFLSWDNYSLREGEMRDPFYTNLEIIRRISLEKGIPFWNCVLANSLFAYMEPTDATLHLEVYSTLAYGGRGIEYYTYFTPDVGNYRFAAVDPFGHRTATWDMLRRVNLEIHQLAPWIVQLRSTGVYHSEPVPEGSRSLKESHLVAEVKADTLQRPPVAARFLVGEFADRDGKPYLMIVNRNLQYSMRFSLKLRDSRLRLNRISPYSGNVEPFGGENNWLAPGAGILLQLK